MSDRKEIEIPVLTTAEDIALRKEMNRAKEEYVKTKKRTFVFVTFDLEGMTFVDSMHGRNVNG